MANLDFPASPVLDEVFLGGNGVAYQWNGTLWLTVGVTGGDGHFYATGAGGPVSTVGAAAVVPTNVITGNSGGWYSTVDGRYTPPAGLYLIFGGVTIAATTTAGSGGALLYKNGVLIGNASTSNFPGSATAAGSTSIQAVVQASGSDYFELRAGNTTAGTLAAFNFGGFPMSGIQGPPGEQGEPGVPAPEIGGGVVAETTLASPALTMPFLSLPALQACRTVELSLYMIPATVGSALLLRMANGGIM